MQEVLIAMAGSVVGAVAGKFAERLLRNPEVLARMGYFGDFADNLLHRTPRVVTPIRKSLSNSFFELYYPHADSVQISGIALTKVIEYICETKSKLGRESLDKHHLLQNMRERQVIVRLLLLNPDSEYAKERQQSENNPALQDDIYRSIQALKGLKEYLENLHPKDRIVEGRLDVRMTDEKLPCTLFYIEPTKPRSHGTMYLGLLFPYIRGDESPLLYLRNSGHQRRLYQNCDTHFQLLFNSAIPVFQWHSDRVHFY
jgi:hypothetical protein